MSRLPFIGTTRSADLTPFAPDKLTDWDNSATPGTTHDALVQLAARMKALEQPASVGVTFDGNGSAITAGSQFEIEVPFGLTLTSWTITADQSGSITIDVWKDTAANYPPTDADTITGGNEPAITTDDYATGGVTGWTTAITAGDILKFNVDSITTIGRATLLLTGTKT